MHVENLLPRDALRSHWKKRSLHYEELSVGKSAVAEHEADGWIKVRQGKHRARLRRQKKTLHLLGDRAWCVLYGMGFAYLSTGPMRPAGRGGDAYGVSDHDRLVAMDDESTVVVQCRSDESDRKRRDVQAWIQELAAECKTLRDGMRDGHGESPRRRIAGLLVLWGLSPSEADIEVARQSHVLLVDNTGLEYYEALVAHTGPAARYQLLAELFAEQSVPGLRVTVPAVEARFGGRVAYTFAITPAHLMKIAYVAHRARGEYGALGSYQRMVRKSRLESIRRFIDGDGVFPTNIVVNFCSGRKGGSGLRFEQTRQHEDALEAVKLGWLHLPARYQAAWIIDGQHRLLAYSGHPRAQTAFLCVTAFDALPPDEQASLFVEINSKQKSVRGNLLTELHASLHWGSEDPEQQVYSVASRAVQDLNSRSGSPFYQRILGADEKATSTRCITLLATTAELRKRGLFIERKQARVVAEWGPLWMFRPEATLRRTKAVLDAWFGAIAAAAPDVWERGKDKGGFLAMNDGVVVGIMVLRSVLSHVATPGEAWDRLTDQELIERLLPFAAGVGEYFTKMTPQQLDEVRRRRGVEGQTLTTRFVQSALRERFPSFDPPGLSKWVEERADFHSAEAYQILRSIEARLQAKVVSALQDAFGADHSEWWAQVPKNVRIGAATRREETDREHGEQEERYLNLIDYRIIALAHWQTLFQPIFSYGTQGDKEKRTGWFQRLNTIRNKIMHGGSTGAGLKKEELVFLNEIDQWLRKQGV